MNKICRILVLAVILLSEMSMVSNAQFDYLMNISNSRFYNDGTGILVMRANFNVSVLDPGHPVTAYAKVWIAIPAHDFLSIVAVYDKIVNANSYASINQELITTFMPEGDLMNWPFYGSSLCYVQSIDSGEYESDYQDGGTLFPPYD